MYHAYIQVVSFSTLWRCCHRLQGEPLLVTEGYSCLSVLMADLGMSVRALSPQSSNQIHIYIDTDIYRSHVQYMFQPNHVLIPVCRYKPPVAVASWV